MRFRVFALLAGLTGIAHAQTGLGVPRPPTLIDAGLSGPVRQVTEKVYTAEEAVLPLKDLLNGGPWITTTTTFQGLRTVTEHRLGGRTDGIAADVVTTYTYTGDCLTRIVLDDRSLLGGARVKRPKAGTRP